MSICTDELIEQLIVLGLLPKKKLLSQGPPGQDGKSAYQLWLEEGNVGTIQDFLESLRGEDGRSAYQIWLDQGNTGTEADFIAYLKGEKGDKGDAGQDGKSAYQIWLEQGNVGTEQDFLDSLKATASEGYWQDNFIATDTVLTEKKVTLTYTPLYPLKVSFVIFKGIEQRPGVDFVVNGREVSWDSLAVELLLSPQDAFVIRYTRSP